MDALLLDGIGILGCIIISIGTFVKAIYKDKKGYILIIDGLAISIIYLLFKFNVFT